MDERQNKGMEWTTTSLVFGAVQWLGLKSRKHREKIDAMGVKP
jgi:hypothetical protein